MFNVFHRLARAARDSDVRSEGVNLFLADGLAARKEVFHVRMRVIPRFEGDHMNVIAKWGMLRSRPKLDDVARDIHDHL